MTSVKDVAQLAGVSTATVSRVLSDKPYVSDEIRQRVLTAVETLDYRPNRVARSLRIQKTSTIGLIVSDIRNPFFTDISRAVEDYAHQNDYTVFLCNTDENPKKEKLYLDLMDAENVAGIILSPTRHTAQVFPQVYTSDIPVVVIDRRIPHPELDHVLIDNIEAAQKLVEHLIEDGHQRIAAIFGIASTTGAERREGYLRALKAHGIKPIPDLSQFVEAKEEAGCEAVLKLLRLPEPPDAIFTTNSLLTAGALRAIHQRKLAIPDEIAIAGFDETRWTTLIVPPITVIAQPTQEIGQTATELLINRINDPKRPYREVTLKGQLIIRQSCAHHT
jgi:LacI family transcriptional regulator, fructose operon transcriptional repressor